MDDIPAVARSAKVPASRPAPSSPPSRRATSPLYRHGAVIVTRDVLQVDGRRYRIAELSRLRTARGRPLPGAMATVLLSAAVLAAVGVAISFGRQPGGPSRETYLVLLAAVLAPALVAGYTRYRARRRYELWGDHLGGTVLLYSCPDEREFGQITRALRRAQEIHHP
jgi:hypothetical protein